MDDPAAELAAYFRAKRPVPDAELIALTSAARSAGHNRASIAAACQVMRSRDAYGIVSLPGGPTPPSGAWMLYRATQNAVEQATGSRRWPPLIWPCTECG